jgi:hypothetical protein
MDEDVGLKSQLYPLFVFVPSSSESVTKSGGGLISPIVISLINFSWKLVRAAPSQLVLYHSSGKLPYSRIDRDNESGWPMGW